jgi:hypothetical protein
MRMIANPLHYASSVLVDDHGHSAIFYNAFIHVQLSHFGHATNQMQYQNISIAAVARNGITNSVMILFIFTLTII